MVVAIMLTALILLASAPRAMTLSTAGLAACAIRDTNAEVGLIECWGSGNAGIEAQGSYPYTSICLGLNYSCALHADNGRPNCWGDIDKSNMPDGVMDSALALSCGFAHACAIMTGAEDIRCWGELPNNINALHTAEPSTTFTQVSSGGNHSCMLQSDGKLLCVGTSDVVDINGGEKDCLLPEGKLPASCQSPTPIVMVSSGGSAGKEFIILSDSDTLGVFGNYGCMCNGNQDDNNDCLTCVNAIKVGNDFLNPDFTIGGSVISALEAGEYGFCYQFETDNSWGCYGYGVFNWLELPPSTLLNSCIAFNDAQALGLGSCQSTEDGSYNCLSCAIDQTTDKIECRMGDNGNYPFLTDSGSGSESTKGVPAALEDAVFSTSQPMQGKAPAPEEYSICDSTVSCSGGESSVVGRVCFGGDSCATPSICCEQNVKCDTLSCPQEYEAKANAANIFCSSAECTVSSDRDTCCDPFDTCSTLSCPDGYSAKAGAANQPCSSADCTVSSDRDTCCDADAPALTPSSAVPEAPSQKPKKPLELGDGSNGEEDSANARPKACLMLAAFLMMLAIT